MTAIYFLEKSYTANSFGRVFRVTNCHFNAVRCRILRVDITYNCQREAMVPLNLNAFNSTDTLFLVIMYHPLRSTRNPREFAQTYLIIPPPQQTILLNELYHSDRNRSSRWCAVKSAC